jgi:hypothetical protein
MSAGRHPHDSLIRAWLDGRTVQYFDAASGLWVDIEPASSVDKLPHFYRDGTPYRIKPVVVRVRNAIMRDGARAWVVACNTIQEERMTGEHPNFARWLDDWKEFEA